MNSKNHFFDDAQAVLAVTAALISVGLLPQPWQKTVGVLGSALWLARRV